MTQLILEVAANLRNHPKLLATAKALAISPALLRGLLLGIWLGALEFAEDGDLWKGNDEASIRFVASLAGYDGDAGQFIAALQADHWLDDWLIHDWLDHAGRRLIEKYKTRHRRRLAHIWTKHGRIYGRGTRDDGEANTAGSDREQSGKRAGSNREVGGKKPGIMGYRDTYPSVSTLCSGVKTLNPSTLCNNNNKITHSNPNNPIGGLGENAGQTPEAKQPRVPEPTRTGLLFSPDNLGLRVEGGSALAEEAPCGGFAAKEIFDAFRPALSLHGINVPGQFNTRIRHCHTTPAEWLMLFLDKVHAVHRARDGGAWLENSDADPVAMTVAGLRPKGGAQRHFPSDAARGLFMEIMVEHSRAGGSAPRGTHRTSAPAIALELERRKGDKGRVKKPG